MLLRSCSMGTNFVERKPGYRYPFSQCCQCVHCIACRLTNVLQTRMVSYVLENIVIRGFGSLDEFFSFRRDIGRT